MKGMLRNLAIALVLVMLAGMLPAMALADEKVVIQFAAQAGVTETACMEEMIAFVNEKLKDENIEMELIKIPQNDWPDYYQKIVSMFAAGMAPDMGRAAERLLPAFINDDQLLDITEHVEELVASGLYYDNAFNGSAYKDGKYYGVPSGMYHLVTLYNKDMFDAAGVPYPSADWSNPMTFDYITENVPKLTSGEGANKVYGFNYYGMNPYCWMTLTRSKNPDLFCFDKDGNIQINTPDHIATLEWYDNLVRGGYVPTPTETAILSTADMFFSGKLAMTVEGTWNVNRMVDAEFNAGYATTPSGGSGITTQFLDCFVIYSTTKHPEECWRVLETMYSAEGWDIMVKHNLGGAPTLKSAYDKFIDTYVVDTVGEGATQEIDCMRSIMNYAVSPPYSPYWEEAVTQMKMAMEEWLLGQLSSADLANKNQGIMETLKAKSER